MTVCASCLVSLGLWRHHQPGLSGYKSSLPSRYPLTSVSPAFPASPLLGALSGSARHSLCLAAWQTVRHTSDHGSAESGPGQVGPRASSRSPGARVSPRRPSRLPGAFSSCSPQACVCLSGPWLLLPAPHAPLAPPVDFLHLPGFLGGLSGFTFELPIDKPRGGGAVQGPPPAAFSSRVVTGEPGYRTKSGALAATSGSLSWAATCASQQPLPPLSPLLQGDSQEVPSALSPKACS